MLLPVRIQVADGDSREHFGLGVHGHGEHHGVGPELAEHEGKLPVEHGQAGQQQQRPERPLAPRAARAHQPHRAVDRGVLAEKLKHLPEGAVQLQQPFLPRCFLKFHPLNVFLGN